MAYYKNFLKTNFIPHFNFYFFFLLVSYLFMGCAGNETIISEAKNSVASVEGNPKETSEKKQEEVFPNNKWKTSSSTNVEDPSSTAQKVKITEKPTSNSTLKLDDVYFEFNAYKLDENSIVSLQTNAKWLSKNPTVKIEIHGHCDERGTNNYNLGLGEKRALTVKKFLTANGVEKSRIHTVSFGEEKPFCFERTEACWQRNRRAHFQIDKTS